MLDKRDLKIQFTKGKGPGGQHRNKTSSMVRATHKPTGIVVTVDGRDQHKNKVLALKELERRIIESKRAEQARQKKALRDAKIKDKTTIRTYDFGRGVVKDHRSGKTASVKDVLGKGRIDLLRPESVS